MKIIIRAKINWQTFISSAGIRVLELKDRQVLISGGGLRIGRALCEAFAARGARLLIHCRNSVDQALELAGRLPGDGHRVLRADFAESGAAERLLEEAGDFEVLINCAAMYRQAPLLEESSSEFEEQLRVNFLSPLELMKGFARMRGGRLGCVVNFLDQEVASTGSSGAYILSKKSLGSATMLAARQWAPNIRVNAIAPGPVLPPVHLKEGEGMKNVLKKVPLGRQVAMDDLCSACVFLVGNESVTGQVLFVDCGQHLC